MRFSQNKYSADIQGIFSLSCILKFPEMQINDPWTGLLSNPEPHMLGLGMASPTWTATQINGCKYKYKYKYKFKYTHAETGNGLSSVESNSD